MKPTWKIAALLLAIVFLSGFAGFYLGFKFARTKLRAQNNPDAWNVSAMKALDRKLKLTAPQHAKVQAIIDAGVVELKSIRTETVEKTNTIIERVLAQIEDPLTPEQRVEFAKLKKTRGPTTIDMLKVEPRK